MARPSGFLGFHHRDWGDELPPSGDDCDPLGGFGFEGGVCPGGVLPGVFVFGVPFGCVDGVDPGAGVVPGLAVPGVGGPAGGVAVPAGGVAVPAPGAGGPAGGVAVPAGGVAVPAGGVAVPAGGVAAPGVELWPADPEPPAGAVPPEEELCATTQLAQHSSTNNSAILVFDICIPLKSF